MHCSAMWKIILDGDNDINANLNKTFSEGRKHSPGAWLHPQRQEPMSYGSKTIG